MNEKKEDLMFEINNSPEELNKFEKYNVYYKKESNYRLYKTENQTFNKLKIFTGKHPKKLFINLNDKVDFIRNEQNELNYQLKDTIKVDIVKSREILNNLIQVTLSEPRSEILVQIKDTIDDIVGDYLMEPDVVEKLTKVALHDYSTQLHLTNVMLFCIGYAHYCKFNDKDIKLFGMMGLMHDVGKLQIPDYLLQAPRELEQSEISIIRKHPRNGWLMLKESNFDEKIQLAALEHHERLDGTGYPRGKFADELSGSSRAIAIIDVFEALTTWRPYKEPITPREALAIIKQEVLSGKLDQMIFKNFAYSIIGIST